MATIDRHEAFGGNPVARAHARAGNGRQTPDARGPLPTLLVWGVVVPFILALVSNPLGWFLLFLLLLGIGGLLGFGGVL
jgi:hypothetical protein